MPRKRFAQLTLISSSHAKPMPEFFSVFLDTMAPGHSFPKPTAGLFRKLIMSRALMFERMASRRKACTPGTGVKAPSTGQVLLLFKLVLPCYSQ